MRHQQAPQNPEHATAALADGRRLLLASASDARRELLARFALPFQVYSADVDETPRSGEAAAELAQRLATAKAVAVAERCRCGSVEPALVIGCDQVAELNGQLFAKPGHFAAARAQLLASSGQAVQFHTALCLLDNASGRRHLALEPFRVLFRALDVEAIERYLHHEQPYSCAGSFKLEGLGISLFERLEGDDYTALIGLPLLRLAQLLRAEGIALP